MKITLAAIGFKNKDIEFNKNSIISKIKEYEGKTDLLLFGETFLQVFDSLSWPFDIDKNIAISKEHKIINDICEAAKKHKIAVSFGYIELENDKIYSSQLTINHKGIIINNYKRVSPGWRIKETDYHYAEGSNFQVFKLNDKSIIIGLCGDLWYDTNIDRILKLASNLVLWPVYTDFNYNKWNNTEKFAYAKQASLLKRPVLYVNSYCLDSFEEEIARGGAALFSNGLIIDEIPSGKEGCVTIKI